MVRNSTKCHKSVSELLVVGSIFGYRHTEVRQFLMTLLGEDKHNALVIIRTWCVTCVEKTEQLGLKFELGVLHVWRKLSNWGSNSNLVCYMCGEN